MYLKNIIYALYLPSVLFSFTYAVHTLDENADARDKACGEVGECPSVNDCKEICGCNEFIPAIFDNITKECVVDMKSLLGSMIEKYNTEAKIRAEADKIFQGIIVAALLFIVCASVCVIMACLYCCRINYTDYRLKKSIQELAKKVGANPLLRKPTTVQPLVTQPVSESCNVIVEDAGVFCV